MQLCHVSHPRTQSVLLSSLVCCKSEAAADICYKCARCCCALDTKTFVSTKQQDMQIAAGCCFQNVLVKQSQSRLSFSGSCRLRKTLPVPMLDCHEGAPKHQLWRLWLSCSAGSPLQRPAASHTQSDKQQCQPKWLTADEARATISKFVDAALLKATALKHCCLFCCPNILRAWTDVKSSADSRTLWPASLPSFWLLLNFTARH